MGIATDLIYIVLAALLGGFLAHVLRQPLIFGYILAGVVVGPYTGGITVENIHDIEMLAEIGVALLLFTLGLEFSFNELRRLRRITLLGTPIQIIICSFIGYFIAKKIGLSTSDATWIGAAISLSSTMVVLKTLTASNQLETESGRITLAILIAQDLAVVPLMLLVPQLTADAIDYSSITIAIIKSAAFLLSMYFAGTRLLPWLFALIARQGSRELFFLSTLGIALGSGFISHELGLSFALGAFVAGMLVSETDFNHQALSDVSTLRDLFALIFFVSVGMLLDPVFFITNIKTILILTFAVIISKAIITSSIIRFFAYNWKTALTAGLGLSQVGEFAFVVINTGSKTASFSPESFSLMIAVTVVSMIATPSLFWLAKFLSERVITKQLPISQSDSQIDNTLSNHVIIVGGGVVGDYVARVLAALERPYVVIESNHKTMTEMRKHGLTVVYGDGSQRFILEAAGLSKASLIVITTNDKILPLIIAEIKEIRTDIPIVVRVEKIEDLETLSSLKLEEIVQPQLEVGLEMVRQSLLALKIEETQIFALLSKLRAERYELKRNLKMLSTSDLRLIRATRLLEFLWFEVNSQSLFIQQTLEEARIREKYGITIVAIIRGEEFIPTPKPDFKILSGDALGILGTDAQLQSFRASN